MYHLSRIRKVASAVALSLAVFSTSEVGASNITFNGIGPHEYSFPVDFNSFNAVAQYSYVQNDDESFDNSGHRVNSPGTFTAVGFSKYFHFFTINKIPNIGFAWGVVVPEISIQKSGFSANGFGDPLVAVAAWFKPFSNSTLGMQSFLAIPAGSEQVSDHTWGNLTSLFWDAQFADLNVDGHAGFVYRSVRHQSGAHDVDPGTTFHANLRVGYRVHEYLEPFLATDFQTVGSSMDLATGSKLANSNSMEFTAGGGLMFHFTNSFSLTISYERGVDGRNTPVTDAFHFKFAYVW